MKHGYHCSTNRLITRTHILTIPNFHSTRTWSEIKVYLILISSNISFFLCDSFICIFFWQIDFICLCNSLIFHSSICDVIIFMGMLCFSFSAGSIFFKLFNSLWVKNMDKTPCPGMLGKNKKYVGKVLWEKYRFYFSRVLNIWFLLGMMRVSWFASQMKQFQSLAKIKIRLRLLFFPVQNIQISIPIFVLYNEIVLILLRFTRLD